MYKPNPKIVEFLKSKPEVDPELMKELEDKLAAAVEQFIDDNRRELEQKALEMLFEENKHIDPNLN